jgi:hypothetical protein
VAIAWNLFRREPTTLPRCRKLAGAAYRVASVRGDDSDAHGAAAAKVSVCGASARSGK